MCLAAAGCMSITAPPREEVASRDDVHTKSYRLGAVATAAVGDEIVRVKNYSVTSMATREVEVRTGFTIDGPLYSHTFQAGERHRYAGKTTYDGKAYDVMRVDDYGLMFDDTGHVLGKLISGFGNRITPPVVMIYSYDVTPSDARVSRVTRRIVLPEGFGQNYQLVFDGVSGDSIRIGFREYSTEDIVRPSSSQELTYPRNSRSIRFRNLAVDILEVTADRIEYRVTSDTEGAPPP